MQNIELFKNEEFGEIRTVIINNEPWFVAKDISDSLGYAQTSNMMKRIDEEDSKSSILDGMNMKSLLINESGMYAAIFGSKLESAKRFKHWVTSEVLPAIRKNGSYSFPQSTSGQIHLLAKGYAELESKVDFVDKDLQRFKNDAPLFGAESDELSSHVKRKAIRLLGGKDSEAYRDKGVRQRIFRYIYRQIKDEYDLYDDSGKAKSYKALKRKYLADVHEFIDCIELPEVLNEMVQNANMQIRFDFLGGD